MTPLRIDIVESEQGIIIRLSGDGGTVAVDALQRPLSGIQARRPTLVVFDLAELATVASLFMGALVTFRRALARDGGNVKLARPRPLVLEAFQRARLDQVFEFTHSVELPVVATAASPG
ncbi:MAG TPA: STAS domain-containing protein [Gemmataceae bacterium]|nr:STAS domain-containing protein [Gemmataceae bacterium]